MRTKQIQDKVPLVNVCCTYKRSADDLDGYFILMKPQKRVYGLFVGIWVNIATDECKNCVLCGESISNVDKSLQFQFRKYDTTISYQ